MDCVMTSKLLVVTTNLSFSLVREFPMFAVSSSQEINAIAQSAIAVMDLNFIVVFLFLLIVFFINRVIRGYLVVEILDGIRKVIFFEF